MIQLQWSYSNYRTFQQCQRKWYFKQKMASATTKDKIRKEVFYLSQLKSVSAWRGTLVEQVIEDIIIPEIRLGNIPEFTEVVSYAHDLYETQLNFAKRREYRKKGLTKSKTGKIYAALFDFEYNGSISEEKLTVASREIILSLYNLLNQKKFLDRLMSYDRIITQRSLQFKHFDFSIKATPDLIAFDREKPPLIVDWKVHTFGTRDFKLQLTIYALALSKVKLHSDWIGYVKPDENNLYDISLIENQLLINKIRCYSLKEKEILSLLDLIESSCFQISSLEKQKKYLELDIDSFLTTRWTDLCERCNFKKICW